MVSHLRDMGICETNNHPEVMVKVLIVYLVVINLVTFIMYGIDKYKAKKAKWRIPESTLLWMAAVGMRAWHHKTLHKKFKFGVPAILLLHLALAVYLLIQTC